MKETRKAQVTIFIIIGIVLLVSASIVVYMTTLKKVDVIDDVIVPAEVKPVYDYVTNCLFELGKQSLILLGTQGGYIDLSPERIDTRDITLTPNAYVKIDPNNIFKLPLWHYEGEDRTPPIEFMQGELSNHITENLNNCLLNFDDFRPQFDITELDVPKINSLLTEEDIVIRLEYPLNIKEGDKEIQHSEFITHIPVRLKTIWQLASKIMEAENDQEFFEEMTIDLMAMNNKVPMDGMTLECSIPMWRLDDVEKEVQRTLKYYMPRVRTKGTDYVPFNAPDSVYEKLKEYDMGDINEGNFPTIATPDDAYEYNKMFFDPNIGEADDFKVSFVYRPEFGMNLNALPNEAGMLRSKMAPGQSFLSFICINNFHFAYDIIYPVQVRIVDPSAYDDNGYIFQFAFNVLIDDNEPKRESFGVRQFQDFFIDTSFCDNLGGPNVEIKVNGMDEEGYFMSSGLRDANITYHCYTKHCQLGTTGYNPSAPGRYSLITSLPVGCTNPIIDAEKSGYLKTTGQLIGNSLNLEMVKLRKMPFTIKKHIYRPTGNVNIMSSGQETATSAAPEGFDGGTASLLPGDSAAIYINLRDSSTSFEQYLVFNYGQNESSQIEIVDGDASYDIDVMLYNYDRFIGGYKATNVSLKYNDFAGYDEMVFNVFEQRPRPVEDDDVFSMIAMYMSGVYKIYLKPTFR